MLKASSGSTRVRGRQPRLARAGIAALGLALASFPVLFAAPASAAAKPKGYKPTGKHKPRGGFFSVSFAGEGSYGITYKQDLTVNNLTTNESISDDSHFTWNWTQPKNDPDTLHVPYPCKIADIQQCKGIAPGAALNEGSQTLSYTLAESRLETNSDPVTANCSGSLSLASAKHDTTVTGPAIGVKPTNNTKDVVFSVGLDSTSPTPFGLSSTPGNAWDTPQGCQSITTDSLWFPTSSSGALASHGVDGFFVAKSVPVPISVIQSSDTIVMGVSGPASGNGPAPLCAIPSSFADGVTCAQTGSWSGKITFKRVKSD